MKPAILGIDAGFNACGAALLELLPGGQTRVVWHDTLHRVKSDKKLGIRCADDEASHAMKLTKWLHEITRLHAPLLVAIEMPTGGSQNAVAMRQMGKAAGVVVAAAHLLEWPTEWVTPTDVKRTAVGKASASKDAMSDAGIARWPDAGWSAAKKHREHAIDAAFAALHVAEAGGALVTALWRRADELGRQLALFEVEELAANGLHGNTHEQGGGGVR